MTVLENNSLFREC